MDSPGLFLKLCQCKDEAGSCFPQKPGRAAGLHGPARTPGAGRGGMGKPPGSRHTPSYLRKLVTNWSGFNHTDRFSLTKTEPELVLCHTRRLLTHPMAPGHPKPSRGASGGTRTAKSPVSGRRGLLPAARRRGRDKGGMGRTKGGKGVTAGSNKIKLGKGNEGLMTDFSTAKSI